MKKLKYCKILLFAGCCLFSFDAYSANEATKQLINKTLAKYGISAGGKEICGTGRNTEYIERTGVVKCKNDAKGDDNNCWDKDSRLCKKCPNGTIVSKQDHISCRQIVCPEGYELIEVKDEKCPEDFELKEFTENCDSETYVFDEIQATNNYTTQLTNCKNIN